jgi:DNA polymerase-3 subunit beta
MFTSGELSISASAIESGEATDMVACDHSGDSVEIGFNASYITEFLSVVDTPNVIVRLRTAKDAGEFRPDGSSDYRYILMPMRI